MRQSLHISLSSHDEVIFRSREDYNHGFNCLAIAIMETGSRLLGESRMSDHLHLSVQTDDYKSLIKQYRYSYTRYYNAKYHRSGRLGEKDYFTIETIGTKHLTTALCYVLRQGLHHGLCSSPFEYSHSSINCIFRHELGKDCAINLLPQQMQYRFLPDRSILPSNIRMTDSGIIYHDDIIDTRYVEELFITPKSFLYSMGRPSDKKLVEEQLIEQSPTPPITLELLERSSPAEIIEMKRNEYGKHDRQRILDQELCTIIDQTYLPRYKVESIYDLPPNIRCDIANDILKKYGSYQVKHQQLKRCLVI